MLGIPVWVAKEQKGKETCNAVTRLLIDRKSGFAPLEWSIGSNDAYDVVVGRNDGKDFLCEEYFDLDKYIRFLLEVYGEETEVPDKLFTPLSYREFKKKIPQNFINNTISSQSKIEILIKVPLNNPA